MRSQGVKRYVYPIQKRLEAKIKIELNKKERGKLKIKKDTIERIDIRTITP